MLQHFQIKSKYQDTRLPGWFFSFYFQQASFDGIYHPSGSIEWTSTPPHEEQIASLEKQIHDLMIYHIYDQQR